MRKVYEVTFRNGTVATIKLTPEEAKEYEDNGAKVKPFGEAPVDKAQKAEEAASKPAKSTAKKTTASNKKRTAKNK